MKRQLRRVALLVSLLALGAVPGCGDKKVKITGCFVKGGQPVLLGRDTYVTIVFIPEAAAATQTHPARYQRATGTYEIELTPGKYWLNYIIKEKERDPWQMPEEQKAKLYDLTLDQKLDIEIK